MITTIVLSYIHVLPKNMKSNEICTIKPFKMTVYNEVSQMFQLSINDIKVEDNFGEIARSTKWRPNPMMDAGNKFAAEF